MSYRLSSVIENGKTLRCEIATTGSETHKNPVLCFSLQAPATILSGGKKIEGLGGFTAVVLDGVLSAAQPITFVLGFEDPYFWVSNRAWHPQGAYLRTAAGPVPVAGTISVGPHLTPPPARRAPDNGLALIPAPTDWQASGGRLTASGFEVSGAFSDAVNAVDALCQRRNLPRLTGGATALRIVRDDRLPAAGYRLTIAADVTLHVGDRAGAFYGLISLTTLRVTDTALPCGTITDAPRFGWRGFMLDCVREFYPIAAIKKLLDLMALLKLNRFHWHFADDEAFRLEVETAPDLWQKSGFRGEGQLLPGVFGGRAGPTGGTYAKAEVAELIAYAARLNIDILPEIEVPAHALALTAIRPELRDPDDTGTEHSVQGYHRNVVNPALAQTWDLLEPLSLEVADLFPIGMLHLGGDELPENTWSGSPLADAYKAQHGLQTHQDVQGHLMHRLASHLRSAGITPCAWQEAADGCTGGIGNDAILFSWTGAGPGREAARKGHRVVMCPAQHTYFDMAHSAATDDWGANWAANYALDAAFDWNPIPADAPDIADNIIGVEGTFWSEFTSGAKDYEAMIAPRIFALATKAWSPDGATTLARLRDVITCYPPLMQALDWAVYYPAVDMVTPEGNVRRVDA